MSDPEREFTALYLGYSSNLSPVTMRQRCPGSLYVGLAILKDYKWIINSTSYASIIPSPGDIVYGSLYFLTGKDEKALDTSEGVPWLYEKHYLDVHRIVNGKEEEKTVKALAYVDVQRLEVGTIEPDYIVWVHKAIQHGLQSGVPSDYIEKYLRPWVGDLMSQQEINMVRTIPATQWSGGLAAGVRGRVMGGLDRG
ncbi:hypothetical protein ONS95_000720 [Cadophora gregata]|uniref:uncharacterized protein n=1 Tax=Cadophora gregata TaxID=51156 RepID=UPI0026DAE8A4|nr:uncharacterized protein ONS95_000720 [Cadophora gregata]KAK0103104.1 hypothetical protein ONS96_005713 [Cadophora gregata f. sp. sojae]KAK0128769.1 hypothetical protein ONS95_000720 [Cadophora gregata]